MESASDLITKALALYDVKIAALNATPTEMGTMFYKGKFGSAREAMLDIEQTAKALLEARFNAGLVSQSELSSIIKQKTPANGKGFATGSPNAWKDVTGRGSGFSAILHPDEAVIPLPDGRSVPVNLSDGFLDRLKTVIGEGDARMARVSSSRSSRRGEGVTINAPVNMTVNAKDAASFNASKDQMMRDLQKSMDRAARRVGRSIDIDDPTKR